MNILIQYILFSCISATAVSEKESYAEIYKRVGDYLKKYDRLYTKTTLSRSGLPQLENSNKIGLGYDPLHGSPVCLTSDCQIDGFRHPLFELDFTQMPQGSCITKLIPKYVTLDCLPSSQIQTNTEVIDSLDHLKQTIAKGFDGGFDGKYQKLLFSYKYSKATRYMIDNLIEGHSEILRTTSKLTYFKLSMFERSMTLSDEFRSVIADLPCCKLDEAGEIEKYIQDYIFGNFGYSYVKTMVLGGIAIQDLIIDSSNANSLKMNDSEKINEAKLAFSASFNMAYNDTFVNAKHKNFTTFVKKTSSAFLGGDPAQSSMENWKITVKDQPVIVNFGIKYIFDLLNKHHFPNDSQIENKSKLIEQVLNKYLNSPTYCYGNCSGNGECIDTGYFQFGMCKCKDRWSGNDCSVPVIRPSVPSGTLCGHESAVTCDGTYPDDFCRTSWQQTTNPSLTVAASWKKAYGVPLAPDFGKQCSKGETISITTGVGTICGYVYGNITVLCNGRNPYKDACPIGYERLSTTTRSFCYKTDPSIYDLPGTICGRQLEYYSWVMEQTAWLENKRYYRDTTQEELSCDGYYPGRESCPPGYTLRVGQRVETGKAGGGAFSNTYFYAYQTTVWFCSKD